jgi:asparagine synthase (glutamine-hydrolysing)
MKLAKQCGVTFMLDGQGGDKLLAGYLQYFLYYLATHFRNGKYSRGLAEALRSCDLTKTFVGTYLKGLVKYFSHSAARGQVPGLAAKLEMDISMTSLPALLRYEDKNSMWHSIEARVSFLHGPFLEYVASLPMDRKLRNGWTKHVFRLAMKDILPEKIRLRRNKIGFEIPEKEWVGELRVKLSEFFSGPDLAGRKYYHLGALRRLLSKPTLTNEEARLIWRVLNVELWLENSCLEGVALIGAANSCLRGPESRRFWGEYTESSLLRTPEDTFASRTRPQILLHRPYA